MSQTPRAAPAPPPPLHVEWLGRLPYAEAHARMLRQVEDRAAGAAPDTLLLVEHEPVYTVGRHRDASANVLLPGDVPVVHVQRGGDVTFHGPGQLTAYPIVRLPPHRRDVMAWLHGLEDVCTEVVGGWGIHGARDPRNTGVWVDGRKIAAIGIALRRWVSFHGFAINNTVDLGWFGRVNPCGMDSSLVTRIADHATPPDLPTLRDTTAAAFRRWWGRWSAPPPGAARVEETG